MQAFQIFLDEGYSYEKGEDRLGSVNSEHSFGLVLLWVMF